MKRVFSLLTVLAFCGALFAQETMEDPTKTKTYAMPAEINTISIHPVSLIVTSAVDIFPMYVYLTYERNLAPKNALILTPNYLSWNIDEDGGVGKFSMSGYGLGVGLRHYLSKPVSGIYLQAKLNLGYLDVELTDDILGEIETASASGMVAGILGYIGAKGKWDRVSIFCDLGLGVALVGVEAKLDGSNIEQSGSATGLTWETDFGIGYSF